MSISTGRLGKKLLIQPNYPVINDSLKLPESLVKLVCSNNKITILENLPNSLVELNCSNNDLINIFDFSPDIRKILKLKDFSKIPEQLQKLNCSHNYLKTLNNLPNLLVELNCGSNYIRNLDNLPNSLSIHLIVLVIKFVI